MHATAASCGRLWCPFYSTTTTAAAAATTLGEAMATRKLGGRARYLRLLVQTPLLSMTTSMTFTLIAAAAASAR
jgi:hypothetical protein